MMEDGFIKKLNKPQGAEFYKKLFIIGVPVVIQNLINLGLNMIDTLMLGALGEKAVAATGAANQVFFVFSVTMFGILSGSGVFTTQYFGAGRKKEVRMMTAITLSLAVAFTMIVTLISLIFAPEIIKIYSSDSEVISIGAAYLRRVLLAYIFFSVSMVYAYNSRTIQDLKLPTIISFFAMCINAILNYIFIFGKLGIAPLGVNGAAYATTMARFCEMTIMTFMLTYKKEGWLKINREAIAIINLNQYKRVIKTVLPVMFTEATWAIVTTLIMAAYSLLGTIALAAVQVATVVTELLQSAYYGLGNATAMIVGEAIGMGRNDIANYYARKSVRLTWLLNLIIGGMLIALSKPITYLYNFQEETNLLITMTLIAMAFTLIPKMIGYIYIVGILRAGGDTLYCMYLELLVNVAIQLPFAYFAVLVLKASLPVAVLLVSLVEFIRVVLGHRRFKSGRWLRNLIV